MLSRRSAMSLATAAIAGIGGCCSAAAAEEVRIASCPKVTSGPANCVSTASVKQVDLYAAPWTWSDESVSADVVFARLKGAIAADSSLEIVEKEDLALTVRADRKFAVDEIQFRVNPTDRVITFRSQQVDGPESVSDFGTNRKRLDDIRKRIGIVNVMGAEMASADAGPREGVSAQLKAFWGFQSGGGFESVLMDEDE